LTARAPRPRLPVAQGPGSRKGGPLAGIQQSTKITDPVADGSITNIEALRHVSHRLTIDDYRTQRFIATMPTIQWLKKVMLVSHAIHGRLRAKMSSNYLPADKL
jgi:hypothetical protein